MTEQEIRNSLAGMNQADLLELLVGVILHEQELREELDKIKGIIR